MFEEIAASWPLDLGADAASSISALSAASSLRDLALAARADANPVKLQSALLAKYAVNTSDKEECQILCCWVAFNQLDKRSFDHTLSALRDINPARLEIRVLTLLGWLWRNDVHSIAASPSDIWAGVDNSPLLQLCKADFYLKVDDLPKAEEMLRALPDFICPEMLMLQASLLSKQGREQAAIELLISQLHRCPNNIRYYRQLLNHIIEGKDAKNVMPCAHEALSKFGENPEILYHFTTINLYKRQPGLAKRSALLQQVSSTIRPTSINLGNQLATYEMNGQADWLRFLSPKISNPTIAEPQLQANLIMQFASIQSENYQSNLQELVSLMEAHPSFQELHRSQKDFLSRRNNKNSNLNIAWMTGDCNYHPVIRFLYGWFASQSGGLSHNHVLVNLEDHRAESYCDLFRSISGIGVHDVSSFGQIDRLREIREKNYDVVVDLSGWTGGNFITGLNARLAPIQVNYLGYFASQGLLRWTTGWEMHSYFHPITRNGPLNHFTGCHGLSSPGHPRIHSQKQTYLHPRRHRVLFDSEVSITTVSLLIQL